MPNLADPELSALRDLMTEMCPNIALALAEQINSELTFDVDTITAVPIGELQNRSDSVLTTTFSLTAPLDCRQPVRSVAGNRLRVLRSDAGQSRARRRPTP